MISKTIIGVKSNADIVVVICFFTKEYNGSIKLATNFGLTFNQNTASQDNITSIKITHDSISKNI